MHCFWSVMSSVLIDHDLDQCFPKCGSYIFPSCSGAYYVPLRKNLQNWRPASGSTAYWDLTAVSPFGELSLIEEKRAKVRTISQRQTASSDWLIQGHKILILTPQFRINLKSLSRFRASHGVSWDLFLVCVCDWITAHLLVNPASFSSTAGVASECTP